jgi:hypothetical protein
MKRFIKLSPRTQTGLVYSRELRMMSRFYRDSKPSLGSSIIETAMEHPPCQECQSIAEEIAAAFADAWESSGHKFKDAWIATHKMIGGTEEDAARAEEILGGYRAEPLRHFGFAVGERGSEVAPARIREALSRKYEHEALTGHKIQSGLYF